nr:hypothetical protein [Tanacetum cinerariifolium]
LSAAALAAFWGARAADGWRGAGRAHRGGGSHGHQSAAGDLAPAAGAGGGPAAAGRGAVYEWLRLCCTGAGSILVHRLL